MKKILIAVDFSENSEAAIANAKCIASAGGAELVFLHVHEPFMISVVAPGPGVVSRSKYLDFEDNSKKRLNAYVEQSRDEGYRSEGIFAVGVLETEIDKRIKEIDPYLIVVGRSGTGGLIDRLLGSTAARVALRSPCPVLVVPTRLTNIKFDRVVYATQLEYQETATLHQVKVLTKMLNAQLFFVKVNALEQPNRQPDDIFVEQIKDVLGPESEVAFEKAGSVADGIESFCQKVDADLVIISARERGFLEEAFVYPKITKDLLRQTDIPLLVYHIRS